MSGVYISKAESLKVIDTYYIFDGVIDSASDLSVKGKHEFDCSGLSGFSVDLTLGNGGWPLWRFDYVKDGLEGFAYYAGSESCWLWSWICSGYVYDPEAGDLVCMSRLCNEVNVLGELYRRSFLKGRSICPAVFFGNEVDLLRHKEMISDLYGCSASKVDLLVRLLEFIPGVAFFNLVTPFSFTTVSADSTNFLLGLKGNIAFQ